MKPTSPAPATGASGDWFAPNHKLSTPRIQVFEVTYRQKLIHFVNVHRPHAKHKLAVRQEFDATLKAITATLGDSCIVGGDFNGELDLAHAEKFGVVTERYKEFLRQRTTDLTLADLLKDTGLRVMNHAFDQPVNKWVNFS